jgi:hypothetical protein
VRPIFYGDFYMSAKFCCFPGIAQPPTSWSREVAQTRSSSNSARILDAASDSLKVKFGQKTFDAEGLEQRGIYFSRAISWPKLGNSGVTIGRGYDMGQRKPEQVIRELTLAGMSDDDARYLSQGALKRGEAAGKFVNIHRDAAPVMSLEVQKSLFENVTTPEMVNDIKRIFNKPDAVKAYGRASWDDLSPAAQELVFDLRYRGDYTPTTRRTIQTMLVNKDYEGLRAVMNDTAYWKALNVPEGRIKERQELAKNL